MEQIIVKRRLTSTFLSALPPHLEVFNAHLYALVPRRPACFTAGVNGKLALLDPCLLDWSSKTITIHLPLDINPGIGSIDDLDPDFYDAVQAAFLSLAQACT